MQEGPLDLPSNFSYAMLGPSPTMPVAREKTLHTYARHILSVADELIETKNAKSRDSLLRELAWLLESATRLADDLKSRKIADIVKALRK